MYYILIVHNVKYYFKVYLIDLVVWSDFDCVLLFIYGCVLPEFYFWVSGMVGYGRILSEVYFFIAFLKRSDGRVSGHIWSDSGRILWLD